MFTSLGFVAVPVPFWGLVYIYAPWAVKLKERVTG